ncbi:MAG: toprim domain-containing protein [Acidobacteria bacterium]|nr:toprim domain-containing protein [Acidobacteriota bacterium]
MARIPDADLERLKAEVSVERLVEASGIALVKSGKDRLGKCPFHEDREASLAVTPEKNLFHCFGCGAAGGPIDWVMRTEHISFRHAAELLRKEFVPSADTPSPRTTRAIPAPVAFDADDQALLQQVVGYYHETLKQSPEALNYLKARGIGHPEAVERFKLGFANRTLGYSLPIKQIKAGADIRGRLAKVGIYRESGHEHFTGSLVIPVMDEAGQVQEVYGRKILDNLRKGTPYHLYLPGPHKGVWNVEGVRDSKEVILCEALIDALTFWCAGYRNVTAAYGVEGFTPDHLEAFQRYGTERVLIAYDRDEAGDRAALKLAEKLMERGIACYRVPFPKGMDANAYAMKVQPAAKSLGLAIRSAEWMGNGKAPKRPETPVEAAKGESTPGISELISELKPEIKSESKPAPSPLPSLAAQPLPTPEAAAESVALPASPLPPPPGDGLSHEIEGQDLFLTLEGRRYRIRGWQKPLNPEVLKVNLMVSKGEQFHVDTLDLYQAKARAAFVKQAGMELCEPEDALKLDLGKVLRRVEAMQAEALSEALKVKESLPALSETEHAEALALLRSPDLMKRILRDFESLGIVGEEPNKLTGYLAAVSRLLDRPLALLIQSASAAGKSSLMDAVLDLIPEEDLVRYSAMSGQSLFYMGDRSLSHKILAIAEEEGAKQASYALKLLQSEGRVTMASTGKNPTTGMLETHDYTVEGPVMLFLTTTAIDLDEELLNRCLVLTVNESREQTRAIHEIQRNRETLEGLLARTHRETLLALHRNAQRLLQPLAVVNPYADQLSFRDDQTRSRRDHVKYLTLIRSIALLHQFQREVRTHGSLRYIEVIPSDIELANELAQEVLGRTVDELLPQTRKLLTMLHAWVQAECGREGMGQADFHFSRKQARDATGWGDTQVRIHLDRLVEMEFLVTHRGRRGQAFDYELLFQGEDAEGRARLLGLIDFANLQALVTTTTSRGLDPTSRGEDANFAAHSRGDRGGVAEGSRGLFTPLEDSTDEGLNLFDPSEMPKRSTFLPLAPVLSYPQMARVNGSGF